MSMMTTGMGGTGFVPEEGKVYYRQGVSTASPYTPGWIETTDIVSGGQPPPYATYVEATDGPTGITVMFYNEAGPADVPFTLTWDIGFVDSITDGDMFAWNGSAWDAGDIVLLPPVAAVGYEEATDTGTSAAGITGATLGIVSLRLTQASASQLRVAGVILEA